MHFYIEESELWFPVDFLRCLSSFKACLDYRDIAIF